MLSSPRSTTPRSLRLALLAGCMALSLGAAHADGFYAGAAAGTPHYGEGGVNGISGSGSGAAGKVFGGYAFGSDSEPHLALEAGGFNGGHIDSPDGRVKSHGAFADAVGVLPVAKDFSLLASVGAAHVNLDTSQGDGSATGPKLGLGGEYRLNDRAALRAEVERYRPSVFGSRQQLDQFTVGFHIGF